MDVKSVIGKIKMGAGSMLAFLTAFFAALISHIKTAGAKPPTTTPPPLPPPPIPNLPPPPAPGAYTSETWRPYVLYQMAKLASGIYIPIQFAINWIQKESGGNPCAIGDFGVKGPDGYPLEQGITQLWNPDDMNLVGVKSGEFRAYCSKTGSQVCTRALTQAEMLKQAAAQVNKMVSCIAHVNRTLAANKASALVGWRPNGEDYWKLVKCVHGLPGLVSGMMFVTRALGRAPSNWTEFKDQILSKVKLDGDAKSGTERYRKKFPDIFDNAEFTANGVGTAVS